MKILRVGQVILTDQKKNDPSILFMMLTLVVAILANDIAKQHMRSSAAVGVAACTIGLFAVARIRWELKGKWWYWVALLAGAALQLPLIFLMPWSDRYLTGIGAMAFVIPGFLMAYGCVLLAEKMFASVSSSS
jgi:hypothetical protein